MVKVQLVDPSLGKHDPANDAIHGRIVPSLGDRFVASGEIIEVPAEIAGAGPRWRAAEPGDDLSYMETHHDDDPAVGTTVHDLGHGLLAQTEIWARPSDEKEA